MTEKLIQKLLLAHFDGYDYPLTNCYIFAWESDLFAISKSGYSVEVEIKISKSDFKKDFTKTDKHRMLASHKADVILHTKHPLREWLRPGQTEYTYKMNGESSFVSFACPSNHIPNRFYYACPVGLLNVDDIPAYFGLIKVV